MPPTEEQDFRVRLLALVLMLVIAVGMLGCSEDDPPPVAVDPWLVVASMPGGDPLPGIKVVIMDPVTNIPVAGPVVSDQDGRCTFPDLEGGPYQVVPFGGSDYRVVTVEPYRWDLQFWSTKSEGWLPTRVDKMPPEPAGPLVQMEANIPPGGLPRIAGQVIDVNSGDPLAQAFVGTSPFPGGYAGLTWVQDDVTGADGTFQVSEILFGQDPVSGNLVQLQPLLIHRQGYRPLAWTYDPPNGDDNTDITGVTIPLEPIDSRQGGHLAGRLLRDGQPVAGVAIGVGSVGGAKSGVGLPGYTGWTDQEGSFLIEWLPEGVYFIQAGFLVGDGAVYPDQPGNIGRAVTAGQTTEVGDLYVLHEIALYVPATAGRYAQAQYIFPMRWSAVPGATRYVVTVDRGIIGESVTPELAMPEDFTLNNGAHVWSVQAFNDQDAWVGSPEVQGRFYIGPITR